VAYGLFGKLLPWPSGRDSTINLPRHCAKPVLADRVLGVLFMVCGAITPVHADDSAASGGARQRR